MLGTLCTPSSLKNIHVYIQSQSDVGSNCCARFGQGTGPIHINNIDCSGSEYRITDCQYYTDTLDESHNEDWNVYCHIG